MRRSLRAALLFFTLLFSALALLAVVLNVSLAQNRHLRQPHVIIIGAGVAGLSAANVLKSYHITVTMLEARDRVGGRIHTIKPWGKALDLGATWIHGIVNNPIARIARKYKFKTLQTVYDDNQMFEKYRSFKLYKSNGSLVDGWLLKRVANQGRLFEQYLSKNDDVFEQISIKRAMALFKNTDDYSPINDELFDYLVNNAYIYEYAANLNNLSARSDAQYFDSDVSGANVLFVDGYEQIIDKLKTGINIKLKQVVKKVDYQSNGVDVYTKKSKYHADYVIVTVPLGVLQAHSIQFKPRLPRSKRKAIHMLKMGVYDKVYLHFPYAFWDSNPEWIGLMLKDSRQTMDIFNFSKFNGQPDLLVFTGGNLAIDTEKKSDKQIIRFVMSQLRRIYGNAIPKPSSYVITRWRLDPYSKGSYSYQPTGTPSSVYDELAAPVASKLYFAGEATSKTDPSTVHGAYDSGVRAANELLRELTVNG